MRIASLLMMSAFLCSPTHAQDLAIVNATVYPSPEAAALAGASILVRDGKIAALGPHVAIPKGVPVLECRQCVVMAGFWNTHVHFEPPDWSDAAHTPAVRLTRQIQAMLTHSGFTTVVDTGSNPIDTIPLRKRIENGEVAGPRIYTAGGPLYPKGAIPFYLKDLPPEILAQLGQPATPAEAVALVDRNIALGTDIVKLFTGSIVARGHVVPMSVPIATAAAEEGHRHGQLVFAHPSNLAGIQVAMASGVDVLAHAPDFIDGVDEAVLKKAVALHMTMIPTLKLFSGESDIAGIRSIVANFHRLGGRLMFGTDTGFLKDYDVSEEYRQLFLAGLSYRDVLTLLTVAPAERFRVADHEGRLAPDMNGDLTVLSADPASAGAAAFSQVRYTIRNGRVLFDQGKP